MNAGGKMPEVHRFSHEAMTTTFDALIVHEDARYAGQAAAAVFTEINRLEAMLSRHDPGTDISQINRLKPGEYMAVALEVLECLEVAARAYVETNGAFDVAYRSTEDGARPSAMEYLLLSRPGSDEPETPSQFLVGIAPEAAEENYASAEIDLGGIGKGYSLDKAIMIMEDWQIDNFLLNSGTSTVLARGTGPAVDGALGDGWPVGVSGDYRDVTGVASTFLRDCSLSGSGTAVKGQHIRIPSTGEAAPAIASWVKAPSAAWTDAISTALMVTSQSAARQLCEKLADTAAIAIYPAGDGASALVTGEW